jgi:DNA invertase Pin-like site-specific DNA recombinase
METPHGSEPDPRTLIDLFCRKSQAVKSKGGKREVSIKAQEARGRRVAEELGLTVRHVWREVGSASRFSRRKARTEQDKALRAVENAEVGALWLFRVDRWDRRGAGSILKIIEPDDGIPRRLLIDNGDPDNPGISLDSTNPRDRKELINRAEQAREETEILSERVRNTKDTQRANGEWINGTAPYGLKIVIVEIEDDEGDIIEERKLAQDDALAGDPENPERTKAEVAFELIYTLPLEGHSSRAIPILANARGIPSPTGGQWASATVRDMIHNPVYAGWQTTGRQNNASRRLLYRNHIGDRVSVMAPGEEPLMTDEQQKAAEAALRGESGLGVPKDGSTHDTRPKHLLTGLNKCRGCNGGAMSYSGLGYTCWKKGAGKTCPAPAYCAKKSAESYVFMAWSARLTNAEDDDPLLAEVARRWAGVVNPKATEDEKAAREALTLAESALQRVWTDRRAGRYDGPSEAYFDGDLRDATEAVSAARRALLEARGSTAVDISFLLDMQSLTEAWEDASDSHKRELLALAIDEIWVTKAAKKGIPFDGDDRMEIRWAA